jgi:hypothetical protein
MVNVIMLSLSEIPALLCKRAFIRLSNIIYQVYFDFRYPAGYIYVFSVFYYLTNEGKNILFAQIIFAIVYLMTFTVVFDIYRRLKVVP